MHTRLPAAATTHPLMMLGSFDDLRHKLTADDSPLRPWWRHFCALAKYDVPVARSRHGVAGPDAFAPYAVLAGLVTGEAVYLDRVRDAFTSIVASHRAIETGSVAQYHTHITAAVLARWAVYYDWVADLGLFSSSEQDAIAHVLTDLAYVFPMQQLEARAKGFDNQVLNNALGAAAVGYVFGVRRPGGGAVARRMLDSGLAWLKDLLADLPRGGYSCEGSTYQQVVVQSVVAWSVLLVEAITGENIFDRKPSPDATSPRELFEMCLRMIGPSGLLPAWDDYGFQPAAVKAPLALLAARTGDATALGVMHDANMWYRPVRAAWMLDDRLWTLAWWPSEVRDVPPARYEPWLSPHVGGALQGGESRLRLFQYWDQCGGIAQAGRPHVDPNNITLESFDSPILLDGQLAAHYCVANLHGSAAGEYVGEDTIASVAAYLRSAWQAHPESWASQPTDEDALRHAVMGCIGQSNALIVDDEGWYVPRRPRVGRGEALHDIGALKVIRSDATEFYTDRYDVTQVQRSSVVVADRYAVSADYFAARTPHALTWQAYVRPGAVLRDDGGVTVDTAEQVRCDIVPLCDAEVKLVEVQGYPTGLAEGCSTRVELRCLTAREHRPAVALLPRATSEAVLDITADWTCEMPGGVVTCSLNEAYLLDDGAQADEARTFRRRFELKRDGDRARQWFLRLPVVSRVMRMTLNGCEVRPTVDQPAFGDAGAGGRLVSFIDITQALRDGENELVITAPNDLGQTVVGPAAIHRQVQPVTVSAERSGEAQFKVHIGDDREELLVDNRAGMVSFAGGRTNARYAARLTDDSLHVADVTHIDNCAHVSLQSDRPCDLAIDAESITLATVPGNHIAITLPGANVRVRIGACIDISARCDTPRTLTLRNVADLPLFINGTPAPGCAPAPGSGHAVRSDNSITLALPATLDGDTHENTANAAMSLETLHALASRGGSAAERAVLDALACDDWRRQLAAADLAGQYHITGAADRLLTMFTASQAELPYPDIAVGDAEDAPGAAEGVSELGVKRWRVRRACVTALGRLGDGRAVALLEKALTDVDDFFPVTSQIPVALGRLGDPNSLATLRRCINHAEGNTRRNVAHALDLLEGRIDRATFEQRVAVG